MLTKNIPIGSVKAGPDDGLAEGEFVVYPSTFIREPDSYGDVVASTAFDNTIRAWKDSGSVLPGLFGHRLDDPDFYVAYAIDMGTDEHGWWVKGAFDLESPKGNHVYRLVKGRRLTQLSFAYDTIDQGPIELDGGIKVNELREVNVYEFSFVPVGANQDTSVVAIKSTAEAIVNDIKAGRVLSAKTEQSIRTAYEALGELIKIADESTPEKASEGGTSRASGASSPSPVAPNLDLIEAEFMFI